MTTLREVAQQALASLEEWADAYPHRADDDDLEAITALRAALEEPVQEPVLVVEKEPDYWSGGHFHQGSKPHIDPTKVWSLPIGTKLYTAPPQRKPLTEEEIYEMYNEPRSDAEMVAFARAIERAHGIGGQDEP